MEKDAKQDECRMNSIVLSYFQHTHMFKAILNLPFQRKLNPMAIFKNDKIFFGKSKLKIYNFFRLENVQQQIKVLIRSQKSKLEKEFRERKI